MASPKQVRCVICGKEVNKRQTLVINDKGDRACRIHEATQQDAEVVQKKQAEKGQGSEETRAPQASTPSRRHQDEASRVLGLQPSRNK